jgi:hypothetical protein
VEAAAAHMGISAADLAAELAAYDAEVAAAAAAGGAAAGAGVAAGAAGAAAAAAAAAAAPRDAFGKRVFPSRVLGSGGDGSGGSGGSGGLLWVARVTPVVHYTMGGLAVGPDAAVLSEGGAPLAGVWAAGEAAGGLHGRNRLGGARGAAGWRGRRVHALGGRMPVPRLSAKGLSLLLEPPPTAPKGNSLAECVVFGRIAGRNAAAHAAGRGAGGAASHRGAAAGAPAAQPVLSQM